MPKKILSGIWQVPEIPVAFYQQPSSIHARLGQNGRIKNGLAYDIITGPRTLLTSQPHVFLGKYILKFPATCNINILCENLDDYFCHWITTHELHFLSILRTFACTWAATSSGVIPSPWPYISSPTHFSGLCMEINAFWFRVHTALCFAGWRCGDLA